MGPGQEEGGPAADGRGRRGAPGNNAVPADLRPSSLASIEGYLFVERSHPANSQRYREPKKSEFLYQSGPTGSRESSGSARRSSETREKAAPEAGHAVAGISPASGFLAGAAFRISGPNAAGLRALPRAAPGNQPEVHEALRTHCSRERARAALEVLAAPVSGARARRTPVAFSAPLL